MKPPAPFKQMPAFRPLPVQMGGPQPVNWYAQALRFHANGDRKQAAQAFARYMQEPIRTPAVRAAAAAMQRGAFKDAEAQLRAYLASNRGDPLAFRMLGQVALRVESYPEAEDIFRRTLTVVPDFPPVMFELATALLMQGKVEECLAVLTPLLKKDPRSVAARALRATALLKLGDTETPIAELRRLLDADPDNLQLLINYGHALRAGRDKDAAAAAYRRAAELVPHNGEAWWNLANMKTGTLGAAEIAIIEGALASDKPSPFDRFHLRFALARALEDAGDYARSIETYRVANAERLAQVAVPQQSNVPDRVSRMIGLYTPAFFESRRDVGAGSREPIFVLGMPRSGSTLLEQILASHPAIEGTQELPDLLTIVRNLDQPAPNVRNRYPEAVADLAPERLRELGELYLARTRLQRKTDRPFFIDKQPMNWVHAGLIHLILPKARIIDMRRDALGCCLSMFRQHFARGSLFTYSVEGLAAEYRAYHDLMAHLDTVLPGRIKRVTLDALTVDLEGTVRDLLDHLGLPFAPECLRFHESTRAVFTPSAEQVRRPINQEGAALLKEFAPYLDDFRAALGDLAD